MGAYPGPISKLLDAPVAAQGRQQSSLDGDHIGFDAWLLPPATPATAEAALHRLSAAMGPVLLVLVIGASLRLLF